VETKPVVRRAVREDTLTLWRLIDALAGYEKLSPPDDAAKARLAEDLFGPRPRIDAFLAEMNGSAVGYALILETYSSFLALPTLFLEDIFVLSEWRGQKVGSALFHEVIAEARRRGCGRIEWAVLTWNQLAIDFYERYGAKRLEDWRVYRLDLNKKND
jgi:GNAT superfamily N-acetyltransferase